MYTSVNQSSWILTVTDFSNIKKDEMDKRFFLKLSFASKGLDVIN